MSSRGQVESREPRLVTSMPIAKRFHSSWLKAREAPNRFHAVQYSVLLAAGWVFESSRL